MAINDEFVEGKSILVKRTHSTGIEFHLFGQLPDIVLDEKDEDLNWGGAGLLTESQFLVAQTIIEHENALDRQISDLEQKIKSLKEEWGFANQALNRLWRDLPPAKEAYRGKE